MAPNLVTALTDTPSALEQHILDAMPAIERWFRLEWMERTPLFYCAVKVRGADFRMIPLQANPIPNGWHNLSAETLPLAARAAQAALEKICPTKKLLLIPENTPPTVYYWRNILQLQQIFQLAGLQVRIGSINPKIHANTRIALANGKNLYLNPVVRTAQRLLAENFDPCVILLNHALASGIPGILEDIEAQHLLPPVYASQSLRRRSQHCLAYEAVSGRFSKLLGIDPWLISPCFDIVDTTNLAPRQALQSIQNSVNALLSRVCKKHREFRIGMTQKVFVVVKADYGSRNMLVVNDASTLSDPDVLKPLLDTHTNTLPPLVIQEGIHNSQHIDGTPAEPVVYMLDRHVVGGFYRLSANATSAQDPAGIHTMQSCIPMTLVKTPDAASGAVSANHPNRFYMYSVIARLAMLATTYELEANAPQCAALFDGQATL